MSLHPSIGSASRLVAVAVILCCAGCDPGNAPHSTPTIPFDPALVEMRYMVSPDTLRANISAEYKVIIRNSSMVPIEAGELTLSYLWWDGKTAAIGSDGVGVPPLAPAGEVALAIAVSARAPAAKLLLKIDLLDANGLWLSDSGKFKPLHYVVNVLP